MSKDIIDPFLIINSSILDIKLTDIHRYYTDKIRLYSMDMAVVALIELKHL